jgi:hypothetical protein
MQLAEQHTGDRAARRGRRYRGKGAVAGIHRSSDRHHYHHYGIGINSALAQAIGRDSKGKVSLLLYVAGILLAFVDPRIACAIYLSVALLFIPDRRIERVVRRL